jgi:hypothetical protein
MLAPLDGAPVGADRKLAIDGRDGGFSLGPQMNVLGAGNDARAGNLETAAL